MTNSLDIHQIEYLGDFAALKAKMYTKYGMEEIFGPLSFDFPEPLQLQEAQSHEIEIMPDNHDRGLMRHLMCECTRSLLPYIDTALDTIYGRNPIFQGSVDRESLHQIVESVLRSMRQDGVQFCERSVSCIERTQCGHLLRALINVLLLTELLVWRR